MDRRGKALEVAKPVRGEWKGAASQWKLCLMVWASSFARMLASLGTVLGGSVASASVAPRMTSYSFKLAATKIHIPPSCRDPAVVLLEQVSCDWLSPLQRSCQQRSAREDEKAVDQSVKAVSRSPGT